jgi:hypothetical protein
VPDQARSEEEAVALQAQLDIAGAEVERAHSRLAALQLERERAAAQARAWGCMPGFMPAPPAAR